MNVLTLLGALALAIWIYLLSARGGFWLTRERDTQPGDSPLIEPDAWPAVAVVIPARNEAESIAQTVESLCRQDYPGAFRIVVVDDREPFRVLATDEAKKVADYWTELIQADLISTDVDFNDVEQAIDGWQNWARITDSTVSLAAIRRRLTAAGLV